VAGDFDYIRKYNGVASGGPNEHRLLRDRMGILTVGELLVLRFSAYSTGETVILNDTTQEIFLKGRTTGAVYPAIPPKGIWRLSGAAKDGCEEFIVIPNGIPNSERFPEVRFSGDDLRVAEEITVYENAQDDFDWRISKARPLIDQRDDPKLQVTPHLRNHPLKLPT
jgi:hypothetical protein